MQYVANPDLQSMKAARSGPGRNELILKLNFESL